MVETQHQLMNTLFMIGSKKTSVFCLGLNALQQQQRLMARTNGFSCLSDMANLVHTLADLKVDQMAVNGGSLQRNKVHIHIVAAQTALEVACPRHGSTDCSK